MTKFKQEVETWIEHQDKEALMDGCFFGESPKGFDLKCVEDFGGEDQGSDYYAVWKFTSKDGETIYYKFQGWYASYVGSEFRDYFEVKPTPKAIVVYE